MDNRSCCCGDGSTGWIHLDGRSIDVSQGLGVKSMALSKNLNQRIEPALVHYLCGDAHAARNVHTEHNQRALQVLVVVLILGVQVEFVAEQPGVASDTHSTDAVARRVLVAAELTRPKLKKTRAAGKETATHSGMNQ